LSAFSAQFSEFSSLVGVTLEPTYRRQGDYRGVKGIPLRSVIARQQVRKTAFRD